MAAIASTVHKINAEELRNGIEHLREFVAIPSFSAPTSEGYNPENLQRAADYASGMLKALGLEVSQVSIDGSAPYVLAEKIADATRPTLLLYAHYDIQPVDRDKWTTDPFVMTERDGRLYGRGASDDKGGIVGIVTALGSYQRAYGAFPVNIKILFEGEEEYHSSHMGALLQQEGERLKADALVILDGTNAAVNKGTLLNSTRGLINLQLTVKSMEKPVHSGVACIAPDPSLVLAKLMASLENPREIPGYMDDCALLNEEEIALLDQSSQTAESYAQENRLVEGAQLRGNPEHSVYHRIAEEPSISFVNGGWGKAGGGNSIQESATCQVGVRITAGQDPHRVAKVIQDHIRAQDAKGLEVTIEPIDEGCYAWKGDLSRPFTKSYLEALDQNFEASDVQPTGGGLPLIREFEAVFPGMEIIVPGVEDPDCAAHSHDESQNMAVWENAINSLMTFIHIMGQKA